MANQLLNFQLPEELIVQLKTAAKHKCLTVSALLRTLILNYLDQEGLLG